MKFSLWKCAQITSLKAPGNYLDQLCSKTIFVLVSGKPRPPKSMIHGFLNPWEPVFLPPLETCINGFGAKLIKKEIRKPFWKMIGENEDLKKLESTCRVVRLV